MDEKLFISSIYDRPDVHIGSIERKKRSARTLTLSGRTRYEEKDIELPEGTEEIFKNTLHFMSHYHLTEIFPVHSKEFPPTQLLSGPDCYRYISISMTRRKIKIRTENLLFLIDLVNGVWSPEMLCSGSSASDNNIWNPIKYTNIFSKKFVISIGDPVNEIEYTQVWEDNMRKRYEPIVIGGYKKNPFVEIEYVLDHEKFGYKCYTDEAFELFAAQAVDLTLTHRLPVKFKSKYYENDHQITWYPRNVLEYGSLYSGNKDGIYLFNHDNIYEDPIESFEAALFYTPGEGKVVSFVNGNFIKYGGIHVNKTYKLVYDFFKNMGYNVSIDIIKNNLTVFVSCWLDNPIFMEGVMISENINELYLSERQKEVVADWLAADDMDTDNLIEEMDNNLIEEQNKNDKTGKKRGWMSSIWRKIW